MEDNILEALNVRVVGSGEQIIVLGHGLGTDQSAWNRILPFITLDYRLILYDLACAGSVNPDYFNFNKYGSIDGYVDDLFQILDELEVKRCIFVAHSLSCMIAILASIHRPELFSKLILIGASPRFVNDESYHGGFDQEQVDDVLAKMEDNYQAWATGYAPLAVGADVPQALQEFSRTLFNVRPDIALFMTRRVSCWDLRGLLKLVKVPCCIIQTANDVSVPTSVATYLRDHLGGEATVVMLETEGHLPHLSAPSVLATAIGRALAG